MQSKRKKRSRIRAAKITAGHGHKKKNRGAGHRGGRGKSGSGKRGDFKIMKVTKGQKYLGKYGFTSRKKPMPQINLQELQLRLQNYVKEGNASVNNNTYAVSLPGYKLLSKGRVRFKINIKVKSATETAIKKVESAGGKVSIG